MKDPAFLLYYKDFDNDTADWEPEALGWYMRLLFFQAGNGHIPSDIEEIAQIARVKFSEYQKFQSVWKKRISVKFSETLSDTHIKFNNEGVHHHNFKGIYDTNIKIRQSPEYRRFKRNVLTRDLKTCQTCGSKNNLHVHHIKPFANHPELRTKPSNGLTLCKKCHIKEHRNVK